jgi:DNA polymerase I-like protein with 3'-5' exonuclease and polymerase domains
MDYTYWKPGMDIPEVSELIGIDTETELFVDHNFPPLVCLQAYCPEFAHFVWWEDVPLYLTNLGRNNPHAHYVFHNASFDLGVTDRHETLFAALKEGRLHDTYVIDSLKCIKDMGMVLKGRSLAQVAKRRLGIEVDKDKEIRLTFSRSMNKDNIPEEHMAYAMNDAKITYDIAKVMNYQDFPTEPLKTRMMVALDDISRRGFLTDEAMRIERRDHFQKEVDDADEMLADWGWHAGDKGCSKVFQHILEGVEKDIGVVFPRTEKSGKIQTTDEALEPIEGDPFIDAYKMRQHANKMLSTYLGDKNIDADGRVRTRFNLASTGRTTSSNPNIQNIPRKGGIRGMFIPTPGYLLAAVDYAQLELCALAESCYRRFGGSKLMDTINEGMDCHKYMATFFTGKEIDHITKEERQLAKVANFGYPGGLQPLSFQSYALGYGMKVSLEMAEQARDAWLKAFPEMELHLQGQPDFANNGMYRTKTWTGFERGNCISTEIANTEFQSTSGDGASEMLWQAYLAKLRTVNFIHDELIVEVAKTDKETIIKEVADIDKLMVDSMSSVITHVTIKTEAALMTRWFKEAEEVIDEEGCLMVMTGFTDEHKPKYEPIEQVIAK